MAFQDRVAVVTGAGGYIGGEICRQLARAGVRVAATDLMLSGLDPLVKELQAEGCDVRGYHQDVCDSCELRDSFRRIESDFGRIDILVNNAGVWEHQDVTGRQHLEQMDVKEWERILDINLRGVFRCTQCVLPGMVSRGYGRIVNIGSISGECGLPGYSDYSAAKAGVIMLTKTLAMENGKRGVTVNCVSPGLIGRTPAENPGTWLGRNGQAEDVARCVLFFAEDEAGYLTGVDLPVDGGRILGPHNNDW